MNYMRPKEVAQKLGISKVTLYRYAQDANFPKKIKLSPKVTVWDFDEIVEYFKNKNEKEQYEI